MSDSGGYEALTSHGAKVRADVVDVYVFRRVRNSAGPSGGTAVRGYDDEPRWPVKAAGDIELLQLLRTGEPLGGTWQPVMGHVHAGETSVQCALRELKEELGLTGSSPEFRGLWALEQVHPFYIAAIDTIVMSPRFACEVDSSFTPVLNSEHSEHRWVRASEASAKFMWPGQRLAIEELLSDIVRPDSISRERLRVVL